MWRSNALRLGNCSSAKYLRHGVTVRWQSSERSLPVTEREFRHALKKVFKWESGTVNQVPLGFAISGGVDSMALAALYAEIHAVDPFLPRAHGFIVDHRVRAESTEEAKWVAEQLRSKFGMQSTIIPLAWPEDYGSSETKRFETDARTLRYQALGRACRDMQIASLMVAHHGDDQAETVMMRLSNNRLRSGLQAMQSIEWIPECEGIYGVHHSGKSLKPNDNLPMPFPVEQGGIKILRPLLAFEKARLIATCEDKGVEWAEDKTNQMQTLTSRNAIRHMYKHHKLPEALSIKSLINLSLKMQERIKSHRVYAERLFDQCLMKLDIQSGSLLIRFPPFSNLLPRPIETEADRTHAKNNAYCLLHRVAELVTPKSKTPLGQLAATVDRIYPELINMAEEDPSSWEVVQKKSYSVFGVWWRAWLQPSPFTCSAEDASLPHPREWLLTRQPLDTAAEGQDADKNFVYPPTGTTSLLDQPSRREFYRLFDGRFWIHLRNFTADTLIIRIFNKEDFRRFPSYTRDKTMAENNSARPYRYITAAFDLLRPADLRFTLPAVFRKDSITGKETLIGFPTLDVSLHIFGPPDGICAWSVHYKKVDFGSRKPVNTIVPGLTRRRIIALEYRQKNARKALMKLKSRIADGEAKKGRVMSSASNPFVHVNGRTRRKSEEWKEKKERVVSPVAAAEDETDGFEFLETEAKRQEERQE